MVMRRIYRTRSWKLLAPGEAKIFRSERKRYPKIDLSVGSSPVFFSVCADQLRLLVSIEPTRRRTFFYAEPVGLADNHICTLFAHKMIQTRL
jgi:hypothetical protein